MIETAERDRRTRDQILDVSIQLFSERGFANVSIRDICDQAGITPPTIYHYFSSKEKLFQEVIQQTLNLRDFRAALTKAVESYSDPTARLSVFIKTCLSEFPRDFFNPGLFLQGSTQINETSMARVSAELGAVDELALAILREGMKSGEFREVDLHQIHRLLMNLLLSYLILEVHFQPNYHHDADAEFIFEMLMGGLRQPVEISAYKRLSGN